MADAVDDRALMQLALLRHGVAEDAGPRTGWRDEPRALSETGRARMASAARGIARLRFGIDAIVTSPLTRCLETAEIVAAATGASAGVDDRLRPGFDVARALDIALEHPDADTLLLCGHQPDLSDVAAELVGGRVEFKKGALALIELNSPRPGAGVLLALYPPAALRRLGGGRA